MKPIRPARIVGGAIYAEKTPIYVGSTELRRGVDLSSGRPIGVMVREPSEHRGPQSELLAAFERAMINRSKMAGTLVPRLLNSLGRKGRVLAVVEEYLPGAQLADVLDALLVPGVQLPIEIALAVCRPLVPLWVAAESASPPIRFYLDPCRVIVDPAGGIRVLPEYAEERARQAADASSEVVVGPVPYMAPEQLLGQDADPRSGMYTFGILLYELLTGAHPGADTHGALSEAPSKIARAELPLITLRRPNLNPNLAEFIRRCVSSEPSGRFTSWRELTQHFAAVLAQHKSAGPADIVRYLQEVAPAQLRHEPPPIADASVWGTLTHSGYEEVALPAAG
jgi:serine/threonine-protein kinase